MSRSKSHSSTDRSGRRGPLLPIRAGALVLAVAVAAAACSNPLDVDNPNNLIEDDVSTSAAVPATVNGALATTANMLGEVNAIYATATDEVRWIGSRDAWNSLSLGNFDDPGNEFSDAAFPDVGEARYMVDRAVDMAEEFQGELTTQRPRVRAYLYAGITYITIADAYEDFVLPEEPTEPVPPVGTGNMVGLYDTAIGHLSDGISLASQEGYETLETRLLAVRARAHHARGVWEKTHPPGDVATDDPLVESADAAADAQAVLDRVGMTSDWTYELTYSPSTVSSNIAFQINQRGELQFGARIVEADPDDLTDIEAIVFEDAIDDVVSPPVEEEINSFTESDEFAPHTVASAREMHLILAEHALAQGDDAGFETHVNHVREDMDGLTPYDGQIPAEEMLEHSRRANLFLQIRRLADMYRFGAQSDEWLQQSLAATRPGTLFPIALTEIRSNPEVDG